MFAGGGASASPRSEAARKLAETERQRADQAQAQEIARRDLAAATAQADRLADARAQQAAALQAVEGRVQAATDQLAADEREQGRAEASLADAQSRFSLLLPVMLRLSQYPAEAVLAVPAPPREALQGLLVTRALAVTLNREAGALRDERAHAAAAREATSRQAAVLAQDRAQQAARAAELDRVVAQARDQVSQAEAEGRQAAMQVEAAAAQAQTLRDAIAAMDLAAAREAARAARQAAQAEKTRQSGAARTARARQEAVSRPAGAALAISAGQLVVPVAGPVLRAYGAAAEDGPATGVTYGAVPGAYVSAPCHGRVAFAAPFRSYGQLIILECGGGYDIVLAGLGSIAASPGHAVRPGEPLGRMAATGKPSLYVELRANGRPVDPAPFLKAKL